MEQVLGLLGRLASENSSLNSGTVCDGLIGVDGLVQLAATEELGHERLDLGDTGRATDKDDVVDLLAGNLRVLEDLLDGLHRRLEESSVDLLEASTGDVGGEVLALQDGLSEQFDIYPRDIHIPGRASRPQRWSG